MYSEILPLSSRISNLWKGFIPNALVGLETAVSNLAETVSVGKWDQDGIQLAPSQLGIVSHSRDTTYHEVSHRRDTSFLTFIMIIF